MKTTPLGYVRLESRDIKANLAKWQVSLGRFRPAAHCKRPGLTGCHRWLASLAVIANWHRY
jgi:hypothetical protein